MDNKEYDETDASEDAMAALGMYLEEDSDASKKSGAPYPKEPNYVDMDSDVKVKSGINVGPDVDNRDEVLRAATMFMKHPARALSARELAILMPDEYLNVDFAQGYIESLVEAGFLHEVNELDDGFKRYRVM